MPRGFTAEELAELARADAEIEASFQPTEAEMKLSRQLDLAAALDRKDAKSRKATEYRRAYYEAHKAEEAERQRAIAAVRKARGLTQARLAKMLGVTQAAISRWETGAVPARWGPLCEVLPELRNDT